MTFSRRSAVPAAPSAVHLVRLVILVGLLASYALPWVMAGSAALNLNASALAEWASLHPAVRGETPTLFTSLLLRLPLVCIGLLGALWQPGGYRAAKVIWVLLISAALAPPIEFLSALDDPNYRQQAALSISHGIIGWVVIWRTPTRRWWSIAIAAIGASASALGVTQATRFFEGFGLAAAPAAGALLTVAFFVAYALSGVRQQTR